MSDSRNLALISLLYSLWPCYLYVVPNCFFTGQARTVAKTVQSPKKTIQLPNPFLLVAEKQTVNSIRLPPQVSISNAPIGVD